MSKPRAFGFSNPIADIEQREKDLKEGTLKEEITPDETAEIIKQFKSDSALVGVTIRITEITDEEEE